MLLQQTENAGRNLSLCLCGFGDDDERAVNSRHHQAILDLAPGLEIMAYAADGIVEAVRMPEKRFVWAVQWHPEAFWEEDGLNIELFRSFVEAAK